MRKEESFADVLGLGGGTDGGRRSPARSRSPPLGPHSGPSFFPSLELGVGGGCEGGCIEALCAEELAEEIEVAVGGREKVSVALEDGTETAKTLADASAKRELQGGAARS